MTLDKKDVQKLQKTIVNALEDVKAQALQVFDTEHLSPLFERVIIASGTSNRQTRALAASVRDQVREAGFDKPRIEGEDNGEWIIVDCGAAVVHVMQPQIRSYYRLEEIWGDKPVRMHSKVAKAAAAKLEAEKKPVVKKAAAKKPSAAKPSGAGTAAPAAPKKVPAKKAAAPVRTASAAVKKAAVPAKKAVTPAKKKTAPAAAPSAAQEPVKQAAAPAKKTAAVAKKAPTAPATQAAAKKPAAKKTTAVKKAPAKRIAS